MKITKIHYFFTAPNNMHWNKIGAEAELVDGDEIRQSLYKLKKEVESFFYESKAAAEKEKELLPFEKPRPESREQAIIQDISTCPDLKTLEAYRLIAKNNQAIQEAYETKFNELQNRPVSE